MEGVRTRKRPRLGWDVGPTKAEVVADDAALAAARPPSPPWREDDREGHYVYDVGENLTPRYKILSKMGEGTFGRVLECWDREKREHVAIKVVRSTGKYRYAAMIEINVLTNLAKNDKGLGWDYPCDLWSVGCILVELCSGGALFQTHENLEHLAMMERVLGPLPDHMTRKANPSAAKYFKRGVRLNWPEGAVSRESIRAVRKLDKLQDLVLRHVEYSGACLINLLYGLLKYEPSDRLTALEALNHPFFKNTA